MCALPLTPIQPLPLDVNVCWLWKILHCYKTLHSSFKTRLAFEIYDSVSRIANWLELRKSRHCTVCNLLLRRTCQVAHTTHHIATCSQSDHSACSNVHAQDVLDSLHSACNCLSAQASASQVHKVSTHKTHILAGARPTQIQSRTQVSIDCLSSTVSLLHLDKTRTLCLCAVSMTPATRRPHNLNNLHRTRPLLLCPVAKTVVQSTQACCAECG